ncbi:phage holin [Lactobacillus kitasatonis]|uniref:phage holin n=1 Tax=Lactobacillus kitasatonis TaxID=237446 RepID=UPI0026EBF3D0|nr:phage holin [Lactobacillus kitasatonis]
MTIKDWIYLGITVASYLLAIIAGVYAKDKAKINRATRAGQALDVLGKIATNAVHEVEFLGGTSQEKRQMGYELINQALHYMGINDVTANMIYGALEKAVAAMHLADAEEMEKDPAVAQDVDEKDVLQPVDQLPKPETPAPADTKDVTADDK